jgi:hypothetical protein
MTIIAAHPESGLTPEAAERCYQAHRNAHPQLTNDEIVAALRQGFRLPANSLRAAQAPPLTASQTAALVSQAQELPAGPDRERVLDEALSACLRLSTTASPEGPRLLQELEPLLEHAHMPQLVRGLSQVIQAGQPPYEVRPELVEKLEAAQVTELFDRYAQAAALKHGEVGRLRRPVAARLQAQLWPRLTSAQRQQVTNQIIQLARAATNWVDGDLGITLSAFLPRLQAMAHPDADRLAEIALYQTAGLRDAGMQGQVLGDIYPYLSPTHQETAVQSANRLPPLPRQAALSRMRAAGSASAAKIL